jgi:hypothetical protein
MDNKHYSNNCPPLMQDGRFLTTYIRSRVIDQFLRNANNILTNDDYRMFLQKNGETLLSNEISKLSNENLCRPLLK